MRSIIVAAVAVLCMTGAALACKHEVPAIGRDGVVCLDDAMAWINKTCPNAKGQVRVAEDKIYANCASTNDSIDMP